MPGKDGTGPRDHAGGMSERGRRADDPHNFAGPGGNCLCPNCGKRLPHVAAQPCSQVICPQCGAKMMRE